MIHLSTLNPTLISQLLHDSLEQSNTKGLLFVPQGWMLACGDGRPLGRKVNPLHARTHLRWMPLNTCKCSVQVNWAPSWMIWYGVGAFLGFPTPRLSTSFSWKLHILMSVSGALHCEVSKSELVVSSCSHVCRYQPPQCILTCLRVSITQCSGFPQPFNISWFKSISCVWFVAFPLLFQVFPRCLECLLQWHKPLISDDAEGLFQMLINASLKWWKCIWFIKRTIVLSNCCNEVAQKPV